MKNKIFNLIVCGDSFNAPGNLEFSGTHWSELVATELNLELINLAMPGCSNRAVCYQMIDCLRRPGSIVIAAPAASPLRIEITSTPEEFGRDISTFIYSKRDEHPLEKWGSLLIPPHIRSVPISMVDDKEIQNVFLNKVSTSIMRDIDQWCLLATLKILKNNKVPFLFFEKVWWEQLSEHITLEDYLGFVDMEDLVLLKDLGDPIKVYNHTEMTKEEIDELDPGYHTHPDEQKKIATYIINRLRTQFSQFNL
jgi:hypothetical protein